MGDSLLDGNAWERVGVVVGALVAEASGVACGVGGRDELAAGVAEVPRCVNVEPFVEVMDEFCGVTGRGCISPRRHGMHVGVGPCNQYDIGYADLPLLHPLGDIDQDGLTGFEFTVLGEAVSTELVIVAFEFWVAQWCCARIAEFHGGPLFLYGFSTAMLLLLWWGCKSEAGGVGPSCLHWPRSGGRASGTENHVHQAV